jgi:putative cardiolipin synthase
MIKSFLLCLTLAVAACAPLGPSDAPSEASLGPAKAPVWAGLERLPFVDQQVLLNVGMEALDLRLAAIDSAVSSVDLQTFLWSFDRAGGAVARHLLAAAQRGVRVRVLVDDTFLLGEDAVVKAFAGHENIEYRIFNPHKARAPDLMSAQALNIPDLKRLDHRMHNKAMVVDGRIAIAGGRNLADEYFGLHSNANFRDLELLLRGPIVGDIARAFDRYWNSPWCFPAEDILEGEAATFAAGNADGLHRESTPEALAELWPGLFSDAAQGDIRLVVDEPPWESPALASEAPVQVARFLTELLDSAEEEIVILSAYLIPTEQLEDAVRRAAGRGVRVRILTNSLASNNHLVAHSAYRRHIETLLGHGVELYEVRVDAKDRPLYMILPWEEKQLALHAKGLLVDHDRVFIGSANLDPRSLRINTEMGFLIESEALNERLRDAFRPDFAAGNAWSLEFGDDGRLLWRSGETTLAVQPATSFMQRLEDWFLSTLPIEDEL